MEEHCRGCIRYMKSCSGMSKRLCEKHKLRIPITNADRIRSMSDEELAEYLFIKTCEDGYPQFTSRNDWLEWLRQEG